MSGYLLDSDTYLRLPKLYATEADSDPIVQAKFFTPWSCWTWYAIEFDGEDRFYGLVDGLEVELGYFSLSELASVRGPGGLRVERDIHFEPQPVSTLREQIERNHAGDEPRLFGPDRQR